MKRVLARGVGVALLALTVLGALPLQAGAVPAPPGAAQLLPDGAYGPALLNRINGAQRRILCVFYLFRVGGSAANLPRTLAAGLIAAQRRGVEVTVYLEGGQTVGGENRATARILSRNGVRVIFPSGRVTTHAKTVAIDDRYVLLGSHNLTESALRHNNELSVLFDSPPLAAQIKAYLERLK